MQNQESVGCYAESVVACDWARQAVVLAVSTQKPLEASQDLPIQVLGQDQPLLHTPLVTKITLEHVEAVEANGVRTNFDICTSF